MSELFPRFGKGGVARVVVDLSIDRAFDYAIPAGLAGEVKLGSRVEVPFGHSMRTGFVVGLAESSEFEGLKEVRSVLGQHPYLGPDVLRLAEWMSGYYAVALERAIRAVLPAPVRKRRDAFKREQVAHVAGGEVEGREELRKKAPKQALVLEYLELHGPTGVAELVETLKVTRGVVKGLVEKGLLRVEEEARYRDPFKHHALVPTTALPLMPQQREGLERIVAAMEAGGAKTVLLYGVTGSGKTEVYLQAIAHAREKGKTAIVLVPEIALTPQTVDRFRSRFGDCVAVLHSELSEGERHDEWHRIQQGRATIVVGARSALFAPVANLGLIVVDEEHEPTYKQDEMPRYNARDVAVMRGHLAGCVVVLGTATPSLESYQNARRGRYELVEMPHRVDHRRMPAIRVVDLRLEAERTGKVYILSKDLVDAMGDRLRRGEQVMLFLNRRGYASSLICPKCGHVPMCDSCSVSLTYHKAANKLMCHMCGKEQRVPEVCLNPACGDPGFKFAGLGTQRIEEIVGKVFTKARIRRMDSDTMTTKDAYRKVLGDFRAGEIDILIGTQMIAKGLDFPNVTLVGVVYADMSLHMPDFRAAERTYQLITQVAGRAGRGDVAGGGGG
ncbi:MAG TPA: primosomal protein N', partial [Kiritimatiellia bacterium]|nr:primosomal protein N' [Kiritimatiellia bacterium]